MISENISDFRHFFSVFRDGLQKPLLDENDAIYDIILQNLPSEMI